MTLINSDCLSAMRAMADNSVDAIVTDHPYGLAFMGKKWDYDVPSVEIWQECLQVLKPGGHLLAFAGTRTQHRMAVRIEDAGFEIRDMIMWVYGSGFPKSLDISKAIDKAAGAEREVVGEKLTGKARTDDGWNGGQQMVPVTAPAKQWQGWGTALKPSVEPITVARKPIEGTVAQNVLKWGTGGINVDGCRVDYVSESDKGDPLRFKNAWSGKNSNQGWKREAHKNYETIPVGSQGGRFPANLIHDGSDEVLKGFPRTQSGSSSIKKNKAENGNTFKYSNDFETCGYSDSGSAARFFYCAKASASERGGDNKHPTVKPISLMRYLCRLVTPPNGIVLDPFMGSGTTVIAAIEEGFDAIGIEMNEEYFNIAQDRIKSVQKQPKLF